MKKLLMKICFLLVLCGGIAAQKMPTEAAVYEDYMTKDYQVRWTDGDHVIYLNKACDKLYFKDKKAGTVKLLKKLKADEDTTNTIVNVYDDKIFLNQSYYLSSNLYMYDLKTDTYKRVKKDCNVLMVYGRYMMATTYMPTDVTPYPVYVYEVTDTGIKKLATLGKHVQLGGIVNEEIYYASYPEDASGQLNVMKVYRSSLNGKNKKLLFTQKSADENTYFMIADVTSGKIVFSKNDNNTGDRVYYDYNQKTGKISLSKDSY